MDRVPLEYHYVLYAAATHSTLLELLTHWQPWLPEADWSDLAVNVPALAAAIGDLASQGHIELLHGPPGGELGLVACADVPNVVADPANWWSAESTPQTELVLTSTAGSVRIPERHHV
jgi:hypothetical protein